jgi:hypothetical protein
MPASKMLIINIIIRKQAFIYHTGVQLTNYFFSV